MTHKPPEHHAVSPFLLARDVPRLLAFLAATFGAEELMRIPGPDGSVRHAEVRIDDSIVMLGERPRGEQPVVCSVHVYVPDVDRAYRAALTAGGSSVVEPRDLPYGDRSGGVKDPEGNLWWIGTYLGRRPNG
jgi:PhnB protein